jgi:hypothetical protein
LRQYLKSSIPAVNLIEGKLCGARKDSNDDRTGYGFGIKEARRQTFLRGCRKLK